MNCTKTSLSLLVLLGLWSCGAPETTNDASSTSAEDTKQMKVFRYSQSASPSSLDPIKASSQKNAWLVSQIYNNLFEFNAAATPEIAMGESFTVSDDGLVYTIKLKDNIYFQDSEAFEGGKGRAVTASDVVYSYNRVLSEESLGSFIFQDRLKRDGDQISDTCFVAVDDKTVRIYLNAPFYAFTSILAMPYAGIVPKEAVEKYGSEFGMNPVGTGAFKLEAWDKESILLVKNPNYFKKSTDGVSYPFIDRVYVRLIADQGQQITEFEKGNLDFLSGVTTQESIERVKAMDRDKFNIEEKPYISTEYIGFQLDPSTYEDKSHPFLNPKVRKALSYAVDREQIVFHFRGGLGEPATGGIVPHGLPSHDPKKVKGYEYNADKAQKLMEEAGYPHGKGFPEITLNMTNEYKAMGAEIAKIWKDMLNINVKVEVNDFQTHDEMVINGAIKLFRGVWIGDFPDEENFLALFYSKNAPQPNKTRYSNPAFDKSFENISSVDGFERHEKFNALESLVMEDAPLIVLYYDQILRVTTKSVSGLEFNGLNTLRLESVDIEPAANAVAN